MEEGIYTAQKISFLVDDVPTTVQARIPLSLITDIAIVFLTMIFQHDCEKGVDDQGRLTISSHTIEYKKV